jgi:uncharacterized protein YkwD
MCNRGGFFVLQRVIQALLIVLCLGLSSNLDVDASSLRSSHSRVAIEMQDSSAYCGTLQEIALVDLINAYRVENGRVPLTLLVPLGAAARHHAESMAGFNYFDFSLVPEGISFAENIATYGYTGTYVGANIAAGPGSFNAEVVFGQWQSSPSQNENLLNPSFASIGIGSSLNSESEFVNYWAASPTRTPTLPASATPTATATTQSTSTAAPTRTPTATPGTTRTVIATQTTDSASSTAACASSRDTARASLEVIITCAGFDAGEEIELYFDQARASSLLASIEADATGTVEYTFLVPEIPADRFLIIAKSIETGLTATVGLDIRPGLLISPRSGDPGDVIGADLTGFQPGETVTIFWNDESLTSREVRRVDVGEDGSVTTTFRAPGSTSGSHTIEAIGVGGGSATATFVIEEN